MPKRGGTPRPSFEERASASDVLSNTWRMNEAAWTGVDVLKPAVPPGSRLSWYEDGIHQTSTSLVTDDGITLFRYYRTGSGRWRMRLNGEWMDVADEETARNIAALLYGDIEENDDA